MVYFGQNEQVPGNRTLNLIQTTCKLHRLLADNLEASIKFFQTLLGDERTRVQGFFNLRVLCQLAKFLVYFPCSFSALANVAKERQEDVLRISGWHDFSPSMIGVRLVPLKKRNGTTKRMGR